MQENKQIKRRVIRISRKKLIWGIVILVLVLIFGGYIYIRNEARFGASPMYESVGSFNSSSKGIGSSIMPSASYDDSYGYQNQRPSIKDTREFLKTNYDATIKTRDVSDVVKQVKNIVKGADGRVDQFNSSLKYGRVSFVVAKSKFDAFKDEVESITHKKLYTESISSQNLLGEKQGIEGQIVDANQSLDSLIAQRTELTNTHNKTVGVFNKEMTRINGELATIRTSINLEKNTQILVSLHNQEASLVEQYAYQKQKLTEENKSYASKKESFDAMISNASNNLTSINKQDGQFMDNIETVNGYVSVEWISLWEMAVIFSPIHPTLIIIILIIVFFVCNRKKMPKVEIV